MVEVFLEQHSDHSFSITKLFSIAQNWHCYQLLVSLESFIDLADEVAV